MSAKKAARTGVKKAAKTSKVKRTRVPIYSARKGPSLDLPNGETRDISPLDLLLDPQNLRLLERQDPALDLVDVRLFAQPAIQKRIYSIISEDPLFDVKSLVISIINNGFLKHERLIVARYDSDHYLVLEGNRRLTAVKQIFAKYGHELSELSPAVRQSLQTLPCFVLDGSAIDGSEKNLNSFRKASEIYIGMRHLMGSKAWEPASRYEFQARLVVDDGWTPDEVAERFGRRKSEVIRDLKAQRLYQHFREFEKKSKIEHSLTYNAFAEAARASSIMRWLEWSDENIDIGNKKAEDAFFHYLISRLKSKNASDADDVEADSPQESAESIVRHLREMLKLDDELIKDALLDRDFGGAEILFEEKREGEFAKRVANFTRKLKRVSEDELSESPAESREKLEQLILQSKRTIAMLDALIKFG